MAGDPQGIERFAPDKLLGGFSRTRIYWYFVIAVAIHLVATAATSVGYIRDRWIDPEGAARRKAEQIEARKTEEARLATPGVERRAPAKAETPKAPDAKGKAEPPDEARRKAPVVKEITDLPKKGEIPKQPDDLGISIDETNK